MGSFLRPLLSMLLLGLATLAQATHNEAGEILVCHVGGPGSLTYEVTIITYTNPNSPADRPEFIVDWGDNSQQDTIARTSSDVVVVAGVTTQRNLYIHSHVYPGPGVYLLQYIDPNRVADVLNIQGSVNVPMCVQTQLVISVAGNNCSPRFLNPPIQNACLGQPWVHNPGAYDTDGDSLSFEPMVCLGGDLDGDGLGDPIPGYKFPNEVMPGPNNQYAIDPVTGTITWNAPQQSGIYNIAFIVREWRMINGQWVCVGWVERDMQVIVGPCNNRPPQLVQLNDTCVEAGTLLTFAMQATDPDAGQTITLDAMGGPFQVPSSPAVFASSPAQGVVNGVFSWNTNCSHVRQQPYQVVFSARDNYNPVQLQDYASMFVTVVAPGPENPTATPDAAQMLLAWDAGPCTNATGYRLYRRVGHSPWEHGYCETGVPAYAGYQYIGSTTGLNSTSFTDQGLNFGIQYCYRVVATFPDGAESYASVEFCNMLQRDLPVMTHVSVGITDQATGVDTVRWSNAYDLDTLQYPGPYQFKLYRGNGLNNANPQLVYTSSTYPYLAHPDTSFIDQGLDTRTTGHSYSVAFYANHGTDLVGTGNAASSVFLVPDPNDGQITLHMEHFTPWINTQYEVYRQNGAVFELVATTTQPSYTDTGLVNGQEYCYYVKSIGAYDDPRITAPLINFSQQTCARPQDLTPPCPPVLALDNDCERPLNTLAWTNPNNSCASDTWRYNIWFSDSFGGTPQLVHTITGAEDTVYVHTDGSSVAGCYWVTAIDSTGNESGFSNRVCGDNCPLYTLPNVFTPNGDRVNDQFIPFPYRGVKKIDLQVFNRWGQQVFSTTDPDIKWDGTLNNSGEPVPDGVYFYVCQVYFQRLEGAATEVLKGSVHVLGGNHTTRN